MYFWVLSFFSGIGIDLILFEVLFILDKFLLWYFEVLNNEFIFYKNSCGFDMVFWYIKFKYLLK